MQIELSQDIAERLRLICQQSRSTAEESVFQILDGALPPEETIDEAEIQQGLEKIKELLGRIPAVGLMGSSKPGEPYWWIKFRIEIESKIAWNVVQELGHVLNYLSFEERLPTTFYPVSAPPHLNGGPKTFLYWVIESTMPFVDTHFVYEYLEGKLPKNVEKEESWIVD
jgi:hypothetical protein